VLAQNVAPDTRLYVRPVEICGGAAADALVATQRGLPLAGGALAFAGVEVSLRTAAGGIERAEAPFGEFRAWAAQQAVPVGQRVAAMLGRICAPRPAIDGLTFDRPLVMGVINVTPDSFYDGGFHFDPEAAIAQGYRLAEEGADILDIGGESTRPGSDPTDVAEELRRVLPVIEGLRDLPLPLSIDTRRARVMTAALEAGARMINDITALTSDPKSLETAAEAGVPVILMHCLDNPKQMQLDPNYDDVLRDIHDYLERRLEACMAAGILPERVIVDPGIGFGKSLAHNLEILRGLGLYQSLGVPVLIGLSRKSFIARLGAGDSAEDRLAGSVAGALWAASLGTQIIRVHDVAETRRALKVWCSLALAPPAA